MLCNPCIDFAPRVRIPVPDPDKSYIVVPFAEQLSGANKQIDALPMVAESDAQHDLHVRRQVQLFSNGRVGASAITAQHITFIKTLRANQRATFLHRCYLLE